VKQQPGMSDWLKWGLVIGAALGVSVAVSVVALGIGKKVRAKLGDEIKTLDTQLTEMKTLIASEERYTQDLDRYATRLRRYYIPVSDEGTLPEELLSRDFRTLDPAEFEARIRVRPDDPVVRHPVRERRQGSLTAFPELFQCRSALRRRPSGRSGRPRNAGEHGQDDGRDEKPSLKSRSTIRPGIISSLHKI